MRSAARLCLYFGEGASAYSQVHARGRAHTHANVRRANPSSATQTLCFGSRADSELVQYVEGAVPDVLATIRDTGDLPPEQAAQLHTNIRVFVALQVAKQSGEAVNGPDIAEASMPRPATVKQDSEEEAASKHQKVEQAVRTSVPSSCCESLP
jgi:hypothetical protein